jgi:hypothetical protein
MVCTAQFRSLAVMAPHHRTEQVVLDDLEQLGETQLASALVVEELVLT